MNTLNHIRKLLLAGIAAWGGSAACNAQVIPPVRIMPLGDSITAGFVNDANTIEGGYRRNLYSILFTHGFNVDFVGTLADVKPQIPDPDHEGHGGYLIEDMLAGIDSWLGQIDDPDVILVHAGTTNFWVGESLSVTQNHLKDLLAELATRRPFAKIIVASLILRTDFYESIQLLYNASLPGIVSDQVAMGRQVYFVDMHSVLVASDLADGVHPTLGGYDKMGARWVTAVNSVITPLGTTDSPAIAAVDATQDLNHVTVKFSKPIREQDVVPGNFSLSGGLAVLDMSLDSLSKRIVTIHTSPQALGTVYTLSVTGVRDRTPAATAIMPGSTIAFTSLGPLVNGGFEAGTPADYGTLDGWTLTGTSQPVGFTSTPAGFTPVFTPHEGHRMAVFSSGSNDFSGSMSQKFSTTPGRVYVLSLDLGIVAGVSGKRQRLQVSVAAGTTLVSQREEITAAGAFSSWVPKSYTFVADSTATTLTLSDASASLSLSQSRDTDMLLDHVQVTEEVSLAVNSSPSAGVNVTVSPVDATGNSNGTTGFTRYYNPGQQVTLTAPASAGTLPFAAWKENGVTYASSATTTVTLNTSRTLTAVYAASTLPVAIADAYTTTQNVPLVVPPPGVLANDTDPKSLPLTAVLNAAPTSGVLGLSANGSFTYTPVTGFSGTDSFTYHASNGTDSSGVVTVSITVHPVGGLANGGFESGVPADYGTLDGWTLTGTSQPVGFTSTPAGFTPVFTPHEGLRMAVFSSGSNDFSGSMSQTFSTTPGHGYVLSLDLGIVAGVSGKKQRLQVSVTGGTTLVSQREEITAAGAFSSWVPKSYTFIADSTLTTLTLSDASASLWLSQSRDTDMLLDHVQVTEEVSLAVNSSPSAGVNVTISPVDAAGNSSGTTGFTRYYNPGQQVTLTAAASAGTLPFAAWIENGATYASSATTTVTLNTNRTLTAVYAASTLPVAIADAYTTTQNAPLVVPAPGVLTNDTDPKGLPLTAVLNAGPTSGVLSLSANGSFTYTPATGFSGTDAFTYHASNGTDSSGVVTVSIRVNQVGVITNGGFESGAPADYGTLDGWTLTGTSQPVGFTSTPAGFTPVFTPHEGLRMAVFSSGSNDFSGSMSQTFSTTPGHGYVLSLDLGIVAGVSGKKQRLQVSVTGGTTLVSQREEITAAGAFSSWVPKSYTFVADSTLTTLTLSDASASLSLSQSRDTDMLLDHVQVTDTSLLVAAQVATNNGTVVPSLATASITVIPQDEFSQWLAEFNLTADSAADPDGDSISNAVEYVIGGNPATHSDIALLPTGTRVTAGMLGNPTPQDYLLFTYRRTDMAKNNPATSIKVEWTADLAGPWTDIITTQGVVSVEEKIADSPGVELIKIYIPSSSHNRMFARLRVAVSMP
ncbi:MAG: Ig-like domain-containing protein [Verrucomicrobiota bacterium]